MRPPDKSPSSATHCRSPGLPYLPEQLPLQGPAVPSPCGVPGSVLGYAEKMYLLNHALSDVIALLLSLI